MNELIVRISTSSPVVAPALQQASAEGSTIDITTPVGVFTVYLDEIEEAS